jgi:hypothetical protein
MPLNISVVEFMFCAVQNGIRSFFRIYCSILFGSFISDCYKNVMVVQCLYVYKYSIFTTSAVMASVAEHMYWEKM